MTDILLSVLIVAVVIYGGMILDRLPKSKQDKSFAFELPDQYLTFKIDVVIEDDFKVGFIDGWDVGRTFSLYGPIIPGDGDPLITPSNDAGRIGVKVGPMPDWFKEARIGGVRVHENRFSECFAGLPYDVCRHVLEELRADANQLVSIGFKKIEGKDGKISYPIYSFELSKPLT